MADRLSCLLSTHLDGMSKHPWEGLDMASVYGVSVFDMYAQRWFTYVRMFGKVVKLNPDTARVMFAWESVS